MSEWPLPTNVKELQCFLGCTNFYRCFIRNYISLPSWHCFQVIKDHRNLEQLNPHQARWALFFMLFKYTVTYWPRKENSKAAVFLQHHTPVNQPPHPKAVELGIGPILEIILWQRTTAMEWNLPLGRVHPKLPYTLLQWANPFLVHAGISTTPVSMVRRTLSCPSNRWLKCRSQVVWKSTHVHL